MNKVPTASEFLIERYERDLYCFADNVEALQEFAKLHVEQALLAASENAKWDCESKDSYFGDRNRGSYDFCDTDRDGDICRVHFISVDKQSILTAYPLDKIQ